MEKRSRIISTMGVANSIDSVSKTSVEEELSLKQQLQEVKIEKDKLLLKIKKLEEEKESKDDSFYILIHDLKNCINPTLGFAELLKEGIEKVDIKDREEIEEYVDIIIASTKNAFNMANKSLELMKSESNKIEVEISNVELYPRFKSFMDLMGQEANKKSIVVENKIKEGIFVNTDPSMLHSILENLILNAIKFTNPSGHISVSCEQKDSLVQISVADDGKGISKDRQNKILNSLGDTTTGTNGEKGTGVGIYTCKKLADKIGGTLEVISEGEGKGSTFIVTLPAGSR
ncbi:MAG: HAMP domain-containing sensor histidine kinase [Candidatus Paceibacterota bacterium]|jgi:signal transduction histidine kinase